MTLGDKKSSNIRPNPNILFIPWFYRIFGDFTSVILLNIGQIYQIFDPLAHIWLSRESISVHIFSNFAEYSVKLPNIWSNCRIFGQIAEYSVTHCQMVSDVTRCSKLLPAVTRCDQLIQVVTSMSVLLLQYPNLMSASSRARFTVLLSVDKVKIRSRYP